jgi:hypothetical protein
MRASAVPGARSVAKELDGMRIYSKKAVFDGGSRVRQTPISLNGRRNVKVPRRCQVCSPRLAGVWRIFDGTAAHQRAAHAERINPLVTICSDV